MRKGHFPKIFFFPGSRFTIAIALYHPVPLARNTQYYNAGRIGGSVKTGNTWLVPKSAEKPADGRLKSEKNKENSPKENTCNKYNIMVVDDEPDILDLLGKSLNMEGSPARHKS